MSQALLGETMDIHGGGLDLKFPHHENELAQSESDTDKPFARVWMHNGLLQMGSAKMAGSVGNVVNIADLLKRHTAETVRFLLLGTHYRSPIEYSEERLDEVKRALDGFYRFFERYERITGESFYDVRPLGDRQAAERRETTYNSFTREKNLPTGRLAVFHAHLDDDFNTGGAVGSLFETLTFANRLAEDIEKQPAETAPAVRESLVGVLKGLTVDLRTMTTLLGLFWEPPAKATLGGDDKLVGGLMQLLLDLRANLRTEAKAAAKDNPLKKALFDQTDLIRKRLAELGVTLEDRATGTTWRVG